jgi:hypothetical protein
MRSSPRPFADLPLPRLGDATTVELREAAFVLRNQAKKNGGTREGTAEV